MPEELNSTEEFEAEFRVSYITYKKDDYAIFKAKDLKMDEGLRKNRKAQVSVKGIFPRCEVGDTFKARCKWEYDERYGYTLQSLYATRSLPSNINGIKLFLMRNVKGVGAKTVDKIVKQFGEATFDKIKEGELDSIKGLSAKVKKRIEKKVAESEKLEKLSVYLFKKGVKNYADVVDIYNKLGDDALDIIISNPYAICDAEDISKFPIADTIALNSGIAEDSLLRREKILLFYLNNNKFLSGNIYERESSLIPSLNMLVNKLKLTPLPLDKDLLTEAIIDLEKSGQLVIETEYINGRISDHLLFLPGSYKRECEIAEMVSEMVRDDVKGHKKGFRAFIEAFEDETGITLDKVQEKGVEMAINNRVSILTGGPGTGKTLTINAVIRYLLNNEPDTDIKLCAPTGRAAKRMSELTGMEAYTIHRMLKLGPGNIRMNEDEEFEADYVIVDESSMIDQSLFHILIEAVHRAGASILLVGDKDQLPPVGAGLPFKDLIESGVVPTVRLSTLHRQAKESQININAKNILAGVTEIGEEGLQFDVDKQDFFFFAAYNSEQINNLIIRSIDGLMKIGVKKEDIVVLSPMKRTEVGVQEINERLQAHLNPPSEDKAELISGYNIFREGDRVMQTKNNYNLGVFNGDVGYIKSIDDEEGELVVTYDDFEVINGKLTPNEKDVTYDFGEVNELILAYSTTVHKSQGSEYPIVIMPLSPLLFNSSRTILYTAVTRAKSKFIWIGDTESLKRGIEKIEETKRQTRLRERLRAMSLNGK